MNNIPEWVEIKNENYRVEVDQPRCYTEKDMEILTERLNDLFEEHRDYKDIRANVNYDEVKRCKLCGQIYEVCYELETGKKRCNYCGKGKLEWSLEKLKAAK